ncbi:MAG: nickel pincer cofactor biosynthesis protein LarC [Desulfobulbaceae bacterium]
MKTGFLDCFSGVSGDMLLGALVGAGLPEEELHGAIETLGIAGLRAEVRYVSEQGLSAVRVEITGPGDQPHRRLRDIEELLGGSRLADAVRKKAIRVFRALAEAEAAVHGCAPEEVHFHEVGALDALADITGVVHGLHVLGIDRLACSPLPMARGWVRCAHGDLPLPAPAVCVLLRGKPVYGIDLEQELVTPTGAALVHVLADTFGPMPPMVPERTGYGAGSRKRADGRPNLLRLIVGEEHRPDEAQRVEVIETALDDWSPETWPHVAEQLLARGALDVHLVPIQMKKGRPGFLLRAVCDPAHGAPVREAILTETTAIGLRSRLEQRWTLPREPVTLSTPFGPVRAKKIATPAGTLITPEYEDCRRVALEHDIPIRAVYDAARLAAGEE